MLDTMKASERHLILMVMVAVLTFGLTAIPQLGLDPLLAGLGGVVITALLAYFTPLTKQYGVGSASE